MKKLAALLLCALTALLFVGCAARPAEPPQEPDSPPAVEEVKEPEPDPEPEPAEPDPVEEDFVLPEGWDAASFPALPHGAAGDYDGASDTVLVTMGETLYEQWRAEGLAAAGFGPGELCTNGVYLVSLEKDGRTVNGVISHFTPAVMPENDFVVPYTGDGWLYRADLEAEGQLRMVILGSPEQIGMSDYLAQIQQAGFVNSGYGSYIRETELSTCELMTDGYNLNEGRAEIVWLLY